MSEVQFTSMVVKTRKIERTKMKWNNRYKYIMEKQSTQRQKKIHKELLKYGLDPSKCSSKHEYIIYKYVEEVI